MKENKEVIDTKALLQDDSLRTIWRFQLKNMSLRLLHLKSPPLVFERGSEEN